MKTDYLDRILTFFAYPTSLTGFVMIVGGLYLIYKEKIYIDSQTNEVSTVETPLGTYRTNAPALALFVVGAVLLLATVSMKPDEKQVTLKGSVRSNEYPVQVYVVLEQQSLNNAGSYIFNVPGNPENNHYKLLFKGGDTVYDSIADLNDLKNNEIKINEVVINDPGLRASYVPKVLATVPAEFDTGGNQ